MWSLDTPRERFLVLGERLHERSGGPAELQVLPPQRRVLPWPTTRECLSRPKEEGRKPRAADGQGDMLLSPGSLTVCTEAVPPTLRGPAAGQVPEA